ncbi:MAG: ATP-binding cassette domain-containing protein [Candidatus Marinimicrobia bacterium]|nr:ATP-binding cassette domain-containing protein [Candidatus Neomarinimicrobiota bacterium]
MNILSVEHLSAGYGKKQVLFDVSFKMQKGETTLIIGSNGSGKSTLLKVIYGLIKRWNKEAQILFNRENITNNKPAKLIKKGMVYIPQQNELFENLTVIENIEIAGMQTIQKKELKNRIGEVLEQLPALKELTKRECSRLSGGERKQVSMAMALINKPELIIFDEPLAGVSPKNLKDIILQLEKLKNIGISILLVEHRVKNVFDIANKVIGLKLGNIFNKQLISIEQTNEVMI